jgi:hypothetical protein
MFFEVLSPIYHSPITIESLTYRVLLGTLFYSASAPALVTKKSNFCRRTSAPSPGVGPTFNTRSTASTSTAEASAIV